MVGDQMLVEPTLPGPAGRGSSRDGDTTLSFSSPLAMARFAMGMLTPFEALQDHSQGDNGEEQIQW